MSFIKTSPVAHWTEKSSARCSEGLHTGTLTAAAFQHQLMGRMTFSLVSKSSATEVENIPFTGVIPLFGWSVKRPGLRTYSVPTLPHALSGDNTPACPQGASKLTGENHTKKNKCKNVYRPPLQCLFRTAWDTEEGEFLPRATWKGFLVEMTLDSKVLLFNRLLSAS